MTKGRFITFEGGEGAGKSTQAKLLAETLRSRGLDVVATREPGGSPGAEAIRRLLVEGELGRWEPLTETLLHFAARRDHLRSTVWPALEAGTWVISDRFTDSTRAYQGAGQGVSEDVIARLSEAVAGGFAPDLTVILNLPAEQGLARAFGRGGRENRYERMGIEFHQRLRQRYLDIAAREPKRCVVIAATGAPPEVHARVVAAMDERLRPVGKA